MKNRIRELGLILLLVFIAVFLEAGTIWGVAPQIAAGDYHTVALKSDGTLWAWGYNADGELGNNTKTNSKVPVQVYGGGTNWVAVSAGAWHTAALKSDGTLWAWGYNADGELGNNTYTDTKVPVQVYGGGTNWVAVSAGVSHTVALKSDGTLWAWGYNADGQLGNNSNTDSNVPVQVYGGGTNWVAVAAGGSHTVALKSDGTLWAWGSNYYGQLGDKSYTDSTIPVQVYGRGTNWVAVSAGYSHTAALKSDGTLWAWGSNSDGELGNNSNTDSNVPVQVYGGGTNWAAVSAGWYYTAALKSDGSLWAWGFNSYGELGNNTNIDSKVPVQVYGGDTNWVAVAAGGWHTAALKSGGTWWAWGFNFFGQVGDGTTTDRPIPKQIGNAIHGADFDGDGKADIVIYRPSTGSWFIIPSSPPGVAYGVAWGSSTDIPVPGDYDGDGKTDIAIFRPGTGSWFIIPSSPPAVAYGVAWGSSTDIPVPGDYDGDGKTDIVIFRPGTGSWFIIPSKTGVAYGVAWGSPTDIPVPGDYDGDGKTDIAIFRPSTGSWFIIPSSTGVAYGVNWGTSTDIPVPGDYDGDGKTDIAIFRPSTGSWFIIPSSTGVAYGVNWGTSTDIPVPGDYDGDGKTDIAIYRPSTGSWFIIPSSPPGVAYGVSWGSATDLPITQ